MKAPARVLLCVTGGIAAYKVVEVARSLSELGSEVTVLMTPSAERFVGRQTFASVTGREVVTEIFTDGGEVAHVELARATDLVVVAPATAHTLSRLATGAADDLLSATLLMARCPLLLVPAMHTEMWEHPATQANCALLSQRGARFLGPASGPLLSGDRGYGRMVEPSEILAVALDLLEAPDQLAGKRVLVTAGGTQEPIDPVRFIGNRSSGLMGFALASEAARRGAKVTLVVGDTSLRPPTGVDLVRVRTTDDMRTAVLEAAGDADVVVKAAAVADFKPSRAELKKLKKAAGAPAVELVATPDILKELGENPRLRKSGSLLVGFAAETESDPQELGRLAAAKRSSKGADLIVANDVSSSDSGFGARTNRAVIAGPEGNVDVGLVSKTALAEAVMDQVVRLLKG
ncbi:MAG: bifunctional phosphopantothenoylcysteine decarboxylase/phosphopantothenate--cysteine ligase CoaBC [Actinomycetota bacterium]|nr:bifunctional phosphopantothenoylcysteine decarboxylase/phosphopantothenate--cysteine ligase CoaBC [Actinomycetota bacterium]